MDICPKHDERFIRWQGTINTHMKLIHIMYHMFDAISIMFLLNTQKKKGKFQHSSFLAGAAITAAGRLVVKEGILKVYVNNNTMHIRLFGLYMCIFFYVLSCSHGF